MECPNCGDKNTIVKDSRKVEMNVFRTRYCNKCGNTFYTEERERLCVNFAKI